MPILSLGSSMHRAGRLIVSFVLTAILIGLLTACGTSSPPLGLAPNKELVKKAIALQVSQTQQRLTQQLQSPPPKLEITQVALQQLEPLFIGNLAAYHIRGTYSVKINLSQRQVTQQKNPFDIYLQRQQEGKTWRLAVPVSWSKASQPSHWRTYLIY